jgi:acetylornithine deacetylase
MTTPLTHENFTPRATKPPALTQGEKLLRIASKNPTFGQPCALIFIAGQKRPPSRPISPVQRPLFSRSHALRQAPHTPLTSPCLRRYLSAMLSFSTFPPASPARRFLTKSRGLSSEIMDVFQLTTTLIDIESVTPNETAIGHFLFDYLSSLAKRFNGEVERLPVEQDRHNVFVRFGTPTVTLSTHMDTVPPFIPSRDDGAQIWGRGACDTKGIIAAMLMAAERLLSAGKRNFGLLFVVGEERNSAGAIAAAKTPRGSQYIVNGEPTENQLALGSKGALRFEIVAAGRMAHSAYPELGESAIEKLLNALDRIRKLPLPVDATLGPSTLNIGIIRGGRAPNVIPDEAVAEIFIRVVGDVTALRQQIKAAAAPDAEAQEVLFIPAVRLGSLPGFSTTVVAYTTDIPAFGDAWGQPFLLGPGTIHVAHTNDERIAKSELTAAVEMYSQLVERLLQQ